MGFIDDDGTVIVHSLACPRAALLKATYGHRILATKWEEVAATHFRAEVQLEGIDRHGILQEISAILFQFLRKHQKKSLYNTLKKQN
jgi:GTP pyrophosphokinase